MCSIFYAFLPGKLILVDMVDERVQLRLSGTYPRDIPKRRMLDTSAYIQKIPCRAYNICKTKRSIHVQYYNLCIFTM